MALQNLLCSGLKVVQFLNLPADPSHPDCCKRVLFQLLAIATVELLMCYLKPLNQLPMVSHVHNLMHGEESHLLMVMLTWMITSNMFISWAVLCANLVQQLTALINVKALTSGVMMSAGDVPLLANHLMAHTAMRTGGAYLVDKVADPGWMGPKVGMSVNDVSGRLRCQSPDVVTRKGCQIAVMIDFELADPSTMAQYFVKRIFLEGVEALLEVCLGGGCRMLGTSVLGTCGCNLTYSGTLPPPHLTYMQEGTTSYIGLKFCHELRPGEQLPNPVTHVIPHTISLDMTASLVSRAAALPIPVAPVLDTTVTMTVTTTELILSLIASNFAQQRINHANTNVERAWNGPWAMSRQPEMLESVQHVMKAHLIGGAKWVDAQAEFDEHVLVDMELVQLVRWSLSAQVMAERINSAPAFGVICKCTWCGQQLQLASFLTVGHSMNGHIMFSLLYILTWCSMCSNWVYFGPDSDELLAVLTLWRHMHYVMFCRLSDEEANVALAYTRSTVGSVEETQASEAM
ncbi:hypothetical protein GGF32_004903 [Allomyces javanicus]|nr:hypothetical protein GGF32_004903 [Allomyces javanicus]